MRTITAVFGNADIGGISHGMETTITGIWIICITWIVWPIGPIRLFIDW